MRRLALLALLAIPLAAGQAAVQPTSLDLRVPLAPGVVTPLGPYVDVPVEVRYTFMSLAPEQTATPVELRVLDAPVFLVATFSPTTVYMPVDSVPCGCPRTVNATAHLLVSATVDAPAYEERTVHLAARAFENGANAASNASASVALQAGFHSVLDASAQTLGKLRVGSAASSMMTVTNFGNGPVDVTFRAEGAPEGVLVTPPDHVRIGSRAMGDAANTARVEWHVTALRPFAAGPGSWVASASFAGQPATPGDTARTAVQFTPADDAPLARATPAGPALLALGLALLAARRSS